VILTSDDRQTLQTGSIVPLILLEITSVNSLTSCSSYSTMVATKLYDLELGFALVVCCVSPSLDFLCITAHFALL